MLGARRAWKGALPLSRWVIDGAENESWSRSDRGSPAPTLAYLSRETARERRWLRSLSWFLTKDTYGDAHCHRVRKPNLAHSLLSDPYPFAGKPLPTEGGYMPQNSGSATIRTNMPLSRAERAHRYRQWLRKLRGPIFRRRIRVTDKSIKGLVKRGYLWPEERENSTAIRQAVSLFLRDALRKQRKPKRTKKR
jgi:hypothetical protein